MPYIVKSSLEIGSKIMPWNELEHEKLMKEKEEKIKTKRKPKALKSKKVGNE